MLTPKLLLIVAAVFLLASSVLSYANKGKLAAKNETITQTEARVKTVTADVERAKAAQTKAQKEAVDASTKATDLQAKFDAANKQVTDLEGKYRDAEGQVKTKDGEIIILNEKIAAAAAAPKPVEPSLDLTKQIADLTRERDELKVVKDGFDTQLKAAQTQTAALSARMAARDRGDLMVGLRGRVLAVDRNWNFVVLDLGASRGVNNNATMVIQRGGSLVGRVRITSVEPSQSVADIIPNSVPAGVAVQPGDTVVFSGS